jgi:uncharacterized protein (UPF0179 family)
VRFEREVVHIVVEVYIVNHYCLMFDRGVVHIVVEVYIVNQYCVEFDGGVVHIAVDLHNNMNHFSVKHQTVMVNNITSHSNICSQLLFDV